MAVIPHLDAPLPFFQWAMEANENDAGVGVVGVLDQFDQSDLVAADQIAAERPEQPSLGRSAPLPEGSWLTACWTSALMRLALPWTLLGVKRRR